MPERPLAAYQEAARHALDRGQRRRRAGEPPRSPVELDVPEDRQAARDAGRAAEPQMRDRALELLPGARATLRAARQQRVVSGLSAVGLSHRAPPPPLPARRS